MLLDIGSVQRAAWMALHSGLTGIRMVLAFGSVWCWKTLYHVYIIALLPLAFQSCGFHKKAKRKILKAWASPDGSLRKHIEPEVRPILCLSLTSWNPLNICLIAHAFPGQKFGLGASGPDSPVQSATPTDAWLMSTCLQSCSCACWRLHGSPLLHCLEELELLRETCNLHRSLILQTCGLGMRQQLKGPHFTLMSRVQCFPASLVSD